MEVLSKPLPQLLLYRILYGRLPLNILLEEGLLLGRTFWVNDKYYLAACVRVAKGITEAKNETLFQQELNERPCRNQMPHCPATGLCCHSQFGALLSQLWALLPPTGSLGIVIDDPDILYRQNALVLVLPGPL